MSDLDKQLPKADALMDKIESGENWEPCMSRALEASLRIPEMCRLLLGKGEKSGSVGGTIPTLETGSLLSDLAGGSGLDLSGFLQQLVASGGHVQLPQDSAGGGPRTGASGPSSSNLSFNKVLFGKYRNLKVRGKPINRNTGMDVDLRPRKKALHGD